MAVKQASKHHKGGIKLPPKRRHESRQSLLRKFNSNPSRGMDLIDRIVAAYQPQVEMYAKARAGEVKRLDRSVSWDDLAQEGSRHLFQFFRRMSNEGLASSYTLLETFSRQAFQSGVNIAVEKIKQKVTGRKVASREPMELELLSAVGFEAERLALWREKTEKLQKEVGRVRDALADLHAQKIITGKEVQLIVFRYLTHPPLTKPEVERKLRWRTHLAAIKEREVLAELRYYFREKVKSKTSGKAE